MLVCHGQKLVDLVGLQQLFNSAGKAVMRCLDPAANSTSKRITPAEHFPVTNAAVLAALLSKQAPLPRGL